MVGGTVDTGVVDMGDVSVLNLKVLYLSNSGRAALNSLYRLLVILMTYRWRLWYGRM